mmetsp:Transcript_19587/g.42618  ORF Transcript_19587/g.42618 Transcript_19587/m.42618 type:complete len:222 (+) Transcript_19587:661-1326(+)
MAASCVACAVTSGHPPSPPSPSPETLLLRRGRPPARGFLGPLFLPRPACAKPALPPTVSMKEPDFTLCLAPAAGPSEAWLSLAPGAGAAAVPATSPGAMGATTAAVPGAKGATTAAVPRTDACAVAALLPLLRVAARKADTVVPRVRLGQHLTCVVFSGPPATMPCGADLLLSRCLDAVAEAVASATAATCSFAVPPLLAAAATALAATLRAARRSSTSRQ